MPEPTETEVNAAAGRMYDMAYACGNAGEWDTPGERDWWLDLARAALSAAYAIRDDKLVAAEEELDEALTKRQEWTNLYFLYVAESQKVLNRLHAAEAGRVAAENQALEIATQCGEQRQRADAAEAAVECYREALERVRKLDWDVMRRVIDSMGLPMNTQPWRERLLREMDAARQALQEQSGE